MLDGNNRKAKKEAGSNAGKNSEKVLKLPKKQYIIMGTVIYQN